jgi:hypothetical protein
MPGVVVVVSSRSSVSTYSHALFWRTYVPTEYSPEVPDEVGFEIPETENSKNRAFKGNPSVMVSMRTLLS